MQAKDVIPVVLKDKSTVVLYRVGKEVFCSDANSTAYKYPLVDAKIFDREQPILTTKSRFIRIYCRYYIHKEILQIFELRCKLNSL